MKASRRLGRYQGRAAAIIEPAQNHVSGPAKPEFSSCRRHRAPRPRIIAVGVIPIPFQIAMLVAGAANYSVALFVLAAVIARGIRYYGLAILVHAVGDKAEACWRSNKMSATVVAVAILMAIVEATIWF